MFPVNAIPDPEWADAQYQAKDTIGESRTSANEVHRAILRTKNDVSPRLARIRSEFIGC